MTFQDIFKNSFLEKVTEFSPVDMVIALALAFALGLFIMAVYKKTFTGVMYSQSFCVSLLAMSLITTIIILAITSNVVLSLGMVGALSIVRFRSAVKEPLDIAFLFWSISVGIILGAGLLPLAVFGSIVIGAALVLFTRHKSTGSTYLLVLRCDGDESEAAAMESIREQVGKHLIKSKTVSADGVELTVEVSVKNGATAFVNALNAITGVRSAALVSYNGEYAG